MKTDAGAEMIVKYDAFQVGPESQGFPITVGNMVQGPGKQNDNHKHIMKMTKKYNQCVCMLHSKRIERNKWSEILHLQQWIRQNMCSGHEEWLVVQEFLRWKRRAECTFARQRASLG